jgi:archaellum component FlaG (FlaF/FlaG flagellin family)
VRPTSDLLLVILIIVMCAAGAGILYSTTSRLRSSTQPQSVSSSG